MMKTKIEARVLMTLLAVLTSVCMWAKTPLVTSGKCGYGTDGAGTAWSFDETTKTLTISPEGGDSEPAVRDYYETYDYVEYSEWGRSEHKPAPWRKYTDHNGQLNNGPDELIQHIVVEDGVTVIGEYAFYGLANLEDVTLASSVSKVWEGAMQNDPKMTSVVCLCPSQISGLTEAFDDSNLLTVYVIKQQVYDYNYNFSDTKFEGFLLTGNGFKATPKVATRELLDVQKSDNYHSYCTLTLNGDHTVTINGKNYTVKNGAELSDPYYQGVLKEGTTKLMNYADVTETGDYRYNVSVNSVFADEANRNVISEPFTVLSSPTSGEGWAFDYGKQTLIISGNVTGEPWMSFAGFIENVIVEKDVTKMPANAFTDNDAYEILRQVFMRSTAVVDLNGAFSRKYVDGGVEKDYLDYNIHVPSSMLASYKTTYASWLDNSFSDFIAIEFSVTLPASGVMTFSSNLGWWNDYGLDFSHTEGLKAYIASEFIPATGKVVMERVMKTKDGQGLVLKGTPGATYAIEKSIKGTWRDNLLEKGDDDVDPTGDTNDIYLYLDGTEFKKFTESKNMEGQAYLKLANEDYEGATTPITMCFSDEEVSTEGSLNYGNCHWSYDADTKTLTFSGEYTGTDNFAKEYDPDSSAKPAPWRTWTTAEGVMRLGVEDGIEHIVAEDGVGSIGDYAFYGLKNLESVTLAPSVYSLGEGALQGCSKLKTVICLDWESISIKTSDDGYSVANVGETYYVSNHLKASLEEMLKAFNVKVEGFYLSEGTLKVDFSGESMTGYYSGGSLKWDTDHYTGDISMLGEPNYWIEDAKATINGIDCTYDNKLFPRGTFYYRKENQDPDLEKVTEAGKYYVKVIIKDHFADEAKNTAISEHYADLYVAATSGEGWNYDRDSRVLTISGNVTGEPWKDFKNDMRRVVVEEGVTQLPEKAFYNYESLGYYGYALIKGAGVDLNQAFLQNDGSKEYLVTNVFVPASSVADYSTAYESHISKYGYEILSSDVSIDITDESEGVIAYRNGADLGLSACEGLKAYAIVRFDPATGTLILKSVTELAGDEGYLLMGETGTYNAKVTVGANKVEGNMLMGNYTNPENFTNDGINLLLEGSGAVRGFYPITESSGIHDNDGFLRVKKSDFEAWKALGHDMIPLKLEEANATAIEDVIAEKEEVRDDSWYTLSGVRLDSKPTQKGVYIHQGKLFMIK